MTQSAPALQLPGRYHGFAIALAVCALAYQQGVFSRLNAPRPSATLENDATQPTLTEKENRNAKDALPSTETKPKVTSAAATTKEGDSNSKSLEGILSSILPSFLETKSKDEDALTETKSKVTSAAATTKDALTETKSTVTSAAASTKNKHNNSKGLEGVLSSFPPSFLETKSKDENGEKAQERVQGEQDTQIAVIDKARTNHSEKAIARLMTTKAKEYCSKDDYEDPSGKHPLRKELPCESMPPPYEEVFGSKIMPSSIAATPNYCNHPEEDGEDKTDVQIAAVKAADSSLSYPKVEVAIGSQTLREFFKRQVSPVAECQTNQACRNFIGKFLTCSLGAGFLATFLGKQFPDSFTIAVQFIMAQLDGSIAYRQSTSKRKYRKVNRIVSSSSEQVRNELYQMAGISDVAHKLNNVNQAQQRIVEYFEQAFLGIQFGTVQASVMAQRAASSFCREGMPGAPRGCVSSAMLDDTRSGRSLPFYDNDKALFWYSAPMGAPDLRYPTVSDYSELRRLVEGGTYLGETEED